MVGLNTLIPPGSGLQLNAAFNINDGGEIVGAGMDPSCSDPDHCDYGHAYLLIPCDEQHPGVQGCHYSLAEDTTSQSPAGAQEPITRPTFHQTWSGGYHVRDLKPNRR